MRKFKSKFTKRVLTVIIIVGIIAILLLYGLVYLRYSNKTEEIQSSNKQLNVTIAELKTYHDMRLAYTGGFEQIEEYIYEELADCPIEVRQEDILKLSVDIQENCAINYSNINMSENELLYEVPKDIVESAKIEGLNESIKFMKKEASFVNVTNYENLKSCIEQIYESPNKVSIENIAYIKDEETNVLSGTIDLAFYYATGTGKEYVNPDIKSYKKGTDNIFQ